MPTADQLRVRLLLLAAGIGAIALWVTVAWLAAAQSPLPPTCELNRSPLSGQRGQIAYTKGADLWTALADGSVSRKLIDYGGGAANSPSASGSANGLPQSGSTQLLAAALSPDTKYIAFIVANPPGGPAKVSLRVAPNTAAAATQSAEYWSANRYTGPGVSSTEISWIPPGELLVRVPNQLTPPVESMRLVMVINPGTPQNPVAESASEESFLGSLHDSWAETKNLTLPASVPGLSERVNGPNSQVAGVTPREIKTPLTTRHLTQLVLGTDGREATRVVCAQAADFRPLGFSPAGDLLAVQAEGSSHLMDPQHSRVLHLWLEGALLLDWVNPGAAA